MEEVPSYFNDKIRERIPMAWAIGAVMGTKRTITRGIQNETMDFGYQRKRDPLRQSAVLVVERSVAGGRASPSDSQDA